MANEARMDGVAERLVCIRGLLNIALDCIGDCDEAGAARRIADAGGLLRDHFIDTLPKGDTGPTGLSKPTERGFILPFRDDMASLLTTLQDVIDVKARIDRASAHDARRTQWHAKT